VFERFHLSVPPKAKLPAAWGPYLAYLVRAKLRSRLTQDDFSGKAGARFPITVESPRIAMTEKTIISSALPRTVTSCGT